MRLMPTGLAYLREIGMKVVNDEILRIQLPTITESVDAGQVGSTFEPFREELLRSALI